MTLSVKEFAGRLSLEVTEDVLRVLGLEDGDRLTVHRSRVGVLLRPAEEDLDSEMKLAREIMVERSDLLRKLAES